MFTKYRHITTIYNQYKAECVYKAIKKPRWKGWVERPGVLIKRGHGAQALKVRFAALPNGNREYFDRSNICNQCNSLHDNYT
jgi:hypothetical protein